MTGVDKKRFVWIMIAIVFFFANLIVMAVLAFNAMMPRKAAPASTMPASSQPAEAAR
jgi:flagellar biosynthesis/type III secretory pathway M-ring protein FliF/YscJ